MTDRPKEAATTEFLAPLQQWCRVQHLAARQAEDPDLWFMAQTAPEAYLQQALRKLHAAIETKG